MFYCVLRKDFLHPETWYAKDILGSIHIAQALSKDRIVHACHFCLPLQ